MKSLPQSELLLGVLRDQLQGLSDRVAQLERSTNNGIFTVVALFLLAAFFFFGAGSLGLGNGQAAAIFSALGAALALTHVHTCDASRRQAVHYLEGLEERLDRIGIGVHWKVDAPSRRLELTCKSLGGAASP